jgi:hypothetical protein
LWLGLESADLTPGQRRTTWLAVMIPYTLWFAVAWSAAIDGVFRAGATHLPFLPLAIFLPVIIGAALSDRRVRLAVGHWRHADRTVRIAGGDRGGDRHR